MRQLDALRKQNQDDKDLSRNCVQEIRICFENESTLLDNICNYGAIDLEKLNFDSKTFTLEDYVNPDDDHMYSYKTIEELTKEVDQENLEIEEAALKQITATNNCVCTVDIRTEDVSKKFRELDLHPKTIVVNNPDIECPDNIEEEKSSSSESDVEIKKIDPTDDWLNSIKNQTETEPSQITDVMEHSTITCL